MEFPWIDIVLGIMSGSALCFGIKMLDLRSFYVLMLNTELGEHKTLTHF